MIPGQPDDDGRRDGLYAGETDNPANTGNAWLQIEISYPCPIVLFYPIKVTPWWDLWKYPRRVGISPFFQYPVVPAKRWNGCIVFQIKFLDCVIGRSPSTTYGLYALLRRTPSSLAKNIIWKPIFRPPIPQGPYPGSFSRSFLNNAVYNLSEISSDAACIRCYRLEKKWFPLADDYHKKDSMLTVLAWFWPD